MPSVVSLTMSAPFDSTAFDGYGLSTEPGCDRGFRDFSGSNHPAATFFWYPVVLTLKQPGGDMIDPHSRRLTRFLVLLVFVFLAATSTNAQNPDTLTLSLQPVVTGLSSPIFVTHAPTDSNRLFVLERAGTVRIIEDGSLLSRPMLDISDRVITGGERGLLGMAFHPDYPDTAAFFLNYVGEQTGTDYTYISRFQITSDPDSADAASEQVILQIAQIQANHNGGTIHFGPDDYLYIGMGDGGGSGDPQETAQDPDRLLGKMLRIDVRNGAPYTI
ncbi:hypothetical protein GF420_11140, partial [candidate division GN15 bacterium]|nr:hypothetical protein [candidate division GN15 bacterium]